MLQNKFKISALASNEKFELPDGSYYGSDIQDYFRCNIKKHKAVTDNPPAEIYVNQMEDRVTFRIKTRYYLALLIPETMKVLGSTKSKITKDEKGENVPCLEITDVVLAHCNIPKQQLSRV